MSYSKEQVDSVFQRLTAGQITQEPAAVEASGWETTLPSGQRVLRSTLDAEAEPLIALGREAVPDLLSWVDNESSALRYVAIHALEKITGERPYVPYFDSADAEGHRKKAIEIWRRWHEKASDH